MIKQFSTIHSEFTSLEAGDDKTKNQYQQNRTDITDLSVSDILFFGSTVYIYIYMMP